VNKAAERLGLVADRSVRCPECSSYMEFKTDRAGRAVEVCVCGYRAYIERRPGKRDGEKES
jgi:DNA-directed RNA polymerase subunit RPC12/RpoP